MIILTSHAGFLVKTENRKTLPYFINRSISCFSPIYSAYLRFLRVNGNRKSLPKSFSGEFVLRRLSDRIS